MLRALVFVGALIAPPAPVPGQEATPARILVAYYSETGNTARLAESIRDGAASVGGVEVWLRKLSDVTDEEIAAADGLLIGTPVQWGSAAPAARAFLIRVGKVLTERELLQEDGRVGGAFCTGGAEASGKEMARLSILAALLNMRFAVVGGVAGDGFGTLGASATTAGASPGLSEAELEEGRSSGERFARLTRRMVPGAAR